MTISGIIARPSAVYRKVLPPISSLTIREKWGIASASLLLLYTVVFTSESTQGRCRETCCLAQGLVTNSILLFDYFTRTIVKWTQPSLESDALSRQCPGITGPITLIICSSGSKVRARLRALDGSHASS